MTFYCFSRVFCNTCAIVTEIDLDPKTSGKISVCSLHFRDGYPTKEHPFPMDLLSEKEVGSVKFRGKKKQVK